MSKVHVQTHCGERRVQPGTAGAEAGRPCPRPRSADAGATQDEVWNPERPRAVEREVRETARDGAPEGLVAVASRRAGVDVREVGLDRGQRHEERRRDLDGSSDPPRAGPALRAALRSAPLAASGSSSDAPSLTRMPGSSDTLAPSRTFHRTDQSGGIDRAGTSPRRPGSGARRSRQARSGRAAGRRTGARAGAHPADQLDDRHVRQRPHDDDRHVMAADELDDLRHEPRSAAISSPPARRVPAMPARSIGVPSATTPIGDSGAIARMVRPAKWAARDSNPEPTG